MIYQNIVKAEFVSRPNRFLANVIVEGQPAVSHVKNTGRCRELLVPGCTVYLEDFAGRMGSRKLRYSLIAVEKRTEQSFCCGESCSGESRSGDSPALPQVLLINMDSQAPNKVAAEGLTDGTIRIPGMDQVTLIRPETVYGNSRFDFYLEDEAGRGAFVEVKGCTLEKDGVASFPDAPTERGVKHIEELIDAHENGYVAALLFIVQMDGMKYIVPNDATHPAFGDAMRKASAAGVSILAYQCRVTPDTLTLTTPLPVVTKGRFFCHIK